LGTNIDFTRLSYDDLTELAKAIERLLEEKERGFSLERLDKLKNLLARLGYEFLANWDGPIARALREIFKEALEKGEEE